MDDKHRFTVYTEEVTPEDHWVYLEDVLRMKHYLSNLIHKLEASNKNLVGVLKSIDEFGHGNGHGREYTCANIAAEALKENSDDKTT